MARYGMPACPESSQTAQALTASAFNSETCSSPHRLRRSRLVSIWHSRRPASMHCKSLFFLCLTTLAALDLAGISGTLPARLGPGQHAKALAAGKELFTREWLHDDRRSFAGE